MHVDVCWHSFSSALSSQINIIDNKLDFVQASADRVFISRVYVDVAAKESHTSTYCQYQTYNLNIFL